MTPEQELSDYNKYKNKYSNAKEKYNTAFAEAQKDPMKLQAWPMQGKTLQDAVDKALRDWMTFGFKQKFDTEN